MADLPATRIVMPVGDHDRELFSIRERVNGDLVITPRGGDEIPLPSGMEAKRQHKFSVHRSPASPGFTFNRIAEAKSGGWRKSAAFVLPLRGSLTWPVYACLSPDLANPDYICRPHARDTVVRLQAFRPIDATPFYFVIVTDPSTRFSARAFNQPVQQRVIRLTHFIVHVVWTYLNAPSVPRGMFFKLATSTESINGSEPTGRIENRTSLSTREIKGYFKYCLTEAAAAYVDNYRLCELDGRLPELPVITKRKLAKLAGTFTRTPLIDTKAGRASEPLSLLFPTGED